MKIYKAKEIGHRSVPIRTSRSLVLIIRPCAVVWRYCLVDYRLFANKTAGTMRLDRPITIERLQFGLCHENFCNNTCI